MPTTVSAGPPKLTNAYNKRRVASPKICVMCGKETSVVLANDAVTDFLYTCESHLCDPGFARPIVTGTTSPAGSASSSPSSTTPTVPAEEVEKVKKEYAEKERKKAESASTTTTDSSATAASSTSTATSWLKSGISAVGKVAGATQQTLFPPLPPPSVAQPSASEQARQAALNAKVFALHRDVFRMRVDAAKKKWHSEQAKERLKDLSLPSAPRGPIA